MISVQRHDVYWASLPLAAGRPLPAGWEIRQVPAAECDVAAPWETSGRAYHAEWERLGASCYIGVVGSAVAFKTWLCDRREMMAAVLPWLRRSDGIVYLFDVEVLPEFRRQGIAGGFIGALLRSSEWQAHTAYARVEVANAASKAMFRALGFRSEERLVELRVLGRRVAWWRTRSVGDAG